MKYQAGSPRHHDQTISVFSRLVQRFALLLSSSVCRWGLTQLITLYSDRIVSLLSALPST
jgi:hypothetical protein